MDIAALRAFVVVADGASFSAAAARLHLTQPAISKRVATLEQALDTRLFDRIGKRVTLTEAGAALLPWARRILADVEDGRRAVANLSRCVAGRLSLATSHHIGLHRLPPVLRAYTERYPEVTLDLQFLDSEAACQAVERGELELAIVTLPPALPPALDAIAVWRDPLHVVAGRGHALARANAITALADYPAILPAPGTYTRDLIDSALAPLGVQMKPGLAANYLETIKMLVAVGLGWSVLPQTMIDADICALELPALRLERTLGAVSHRDRTPSNAARALLALLMTAT